MQRAHREMRENMMNYMDYQRMVADLKYEKANTGPYAVAKLEELDAAIQALETLVRMH